MSRLKEYVSSILSHGEFSEQDRIELAEEFLDHLHQLQRDYLQAGHSQEEAERLAIRDFGCEQEIGQELQESQAPHYRLLLLLVGAGTILFTILYYLYALFILQVFLPLPMGIGMLLGSSLLWFYWNPEHIFQRKLLISTILILLTFSFLYWAYVGFFGTKWIRNFLLANTVLLLILSWITLVMTAWKKPLHLPLSERKRRNVIHTANLSFLFIMLYPLIKWCSGILLFGWFFAVFPICFLLGWACLYWVQYKLIGRKPFLGLLFGISSAVFVGLLCSV
ncbi:permease prefix domain 1-containing protein [Brevibacillus laterosporus]|uniref:permease prefix domain 1-containing protein n=1 Tax=Brevibacillus laterosporus TaxID=1465 RepID=UPI002653E8F0|nr:permease prefix domain 1-containing protein [Brevibacillus laterosporus]MDN9010355.1 permease prefix domain 1-containing protein [Brevibacillus laterosporus]MDO0941242.1 permease prefix domain 1-containing protein [Brevibacillus laterosporus]